MRHRVLMIEAPRLRRPSRVLATSIVLHPWPDCDKEAVYQKRSLSLPPNFPLERLCILLEASVAFRISSNPRGTRSRCTPLSGLATRRHLCPSLSVGVSLSAFYSDY